MDAILYLQVMLLSNITMAGMKNVVIAHSEGQKIKSLLTDAHEEYPRIGSSQSQAGGLHALDTWTRNS